MRKELIKQVNDPKHIRPCLEWAESMLTRALEAGPAVIRLSRPTRTLDQNALMWDVLTAISRQVEWYGQKLSPEDWKHVLSAALKGQKSIPGINGGFVVLGVSTSKMSIKEMSDLIELALCFGAEQGVHFKIDER